MLKGHFERYYKICSYLLAKSSVVWPTYQSFLEKKKKKSFRWIYLRRKRSFKTTAQGPGSTSEHGLSCYIFRIIPFIRGMRAISGILGTDAELQHPEPVTAQLGEILLSYMQGFWAQLLSTPLLPVRALKKANSLCLPCWIAVVYIFCKKMTPRQWTTKLLSTWCLPFHLCSEKRQRKKGS